MGYRFTRQGDLQPYRKDETPIVVKTNEVLVERCVVESIQADAIPHVETFGFMATPWENVRGDEQFADWQASNGAGIAIIIQDNVAEVFLPAPLFRRTRHFGFACWRAFDPTNAGAGDDFGGFIFGFSEQRVEEFLTERNKIGGIVMELFPHGAVEVARAFKPPDAAEFQGWIQRGEVAELHRHRARRAADALGEIDNDGLLLIELPEAELVVEIEDDEELVPSPSFAACHE